MKDAHLALLWHIAEWLLVLATVGLIWSIKKRNTPNYATVSRDIANRPK
jgi:hypothetical protein